MAWPTGSPSMLEGDDRQHGDQEGDGDGHSPEDVSVGSASSGALPRSSPQSSHR